MVESTKKNNVVIEESSRIAFPVSVNLRNYRLIGYEQN